MGLRTARRAKVPGNIPHVSSLAKAGRGTGNEANAKYVPVLSRYGSVHVATPRT